MLPIKNGEDGLPIPTYAVYNIGGVHPENLLDLVEILQQELLNVGVLPKDYDFESHKDISPYAAWRRSRYLCGYRIS